MFGNRYLSSFPNVTIRKDFFFFLSQIGHVVTSQNTYELDEKNR